MLWNQAARISHVSNQRHKIRDVNPCPCRHFSWSLGVSSLSWSLGSGPCPCPGGSGPCPYPDPCGLVLVLVLVFIPCKDLFPLFHYSDLFAYYCSVNAYN